jgi:uncharacterized membrane protein YfcA
LFESVIVALLAFLSSMVGAVVGAGGGFIFIPAASLLGLPPQQLIPSSLSMVLANAVSASLQRYRSGGLNVSKTAVLGVAALPLAVLGSLIGSGLSLPHFKAGFGLFLLTTSVFVLTVREGLLKPRAETRFYRVLLTVIAAGFFSTLFGIGGGVLMVPALILTAGLEVHRAVATSQLVTFFTAATGVASYLAQGHFYPLLYTLAGVMGLAGGYVGSGIEMRMESEKLGRFVFTVFAIVGIYMLFSSLQ